MKRRARVRAAAVLAAGVVILFSNGAGGVQLAGANPTEGLAPPASPATMSASSAALLANYVALGDSFSAGFDNPGPALTQWGSSDSPDDGCDRTPSSYPVAVSQWMATDKALPSMTFNFLACSGATTTNLWSASPAVADGLDGGAGNNYDYGEGTQLGSNYSGDLSQAKVVTLSIGGNDLSFPTVMTTCVAAPIDCGRLSTSDSVANLGSNISNLEPVLKATYGQIKAEAPNATIYVTGYPDIVPPKPSLLQQTVGCGPFLIAAAIEKTPAGPAISYLAQAENDLNAAIKDAAASAGIQFVDPNGSSGSNSFVKHTVCSSSSWFNGKFHPSVTGQAALAKLFEAAIGAHTSAPTVTHFSATPTTLYRSGGQVLLSASAANSVTCTFTSKPAIAGLPDTEPCWKGGASDLVTLPPNTGTGVQRYSLWVSLSGSKTVKSTKVTVSVESVGGLAPTFTSATSTIFETGQMSSFTVTATGAPTPSFTESGDLPVGLSLKDNHDGTTTIIGTPNVSSSGTYTLTISASNGIAPAATQRFTLSIHPPLAGVKSVVGDGGSSCALLTSGGVDCWGNGELGNGTYYPQGNSVPVQVVGVGGIGLLTGVTSLVSGYNGTEGNISSFCAVLASGGVDCWGSGAQGELGNGYRSDSLRPTPVIDTSGIGNLLGVTSLVSFSYGSSGGTYCAVIDSGGVDCWGAWVPNSGGSGGLYTSSPTPIQVEAVGGASILSGVTSLASSTTSASPGFCAVLQAGGVDCWGDGKQGQLGNGIIYDSSNPGSATPVQVVGVGGTGTLTGVASLTSDESGYCALLDSGGVDCWGLGSYGELGNGIEYRFTNAIGSPSPVQVLGEGGVGALTGVISVVSDSTESYCAVLESGGVDCWGVFVGRSAIPQPVLAVGGYDYGNLSGVDSMVGGNLGPSPYPGTSYCAALHSGGADCWGTNVYGVLGDGSSNSSANPVQVVNTDGTGTLSGVVSLSTDVQYAASSYCAVVTSGDVDCWGYGADGELGNAMSYTTGSEASLIPVQVVSP